MIEDNFMFCFKRRDSYRNVDQIYNGFDQANNTLLPIFLRASNFAFKGIRRDQTTHLSYDLLKGQILRFFSLIDAPKGPWVNWPAGPRGKSES